MNTTSNDNTPRPSDRRRWVRPIATACLLALLAALIWLPRLNATPAAPDRVESPQAKQPANNGSLDQAWRDGEHFFDRFTP